MLLRNACLRSLSTAKSGCHRWPTPPSSATHSVSVAGCANGGFDQARWATAAVTSAASRGALGSPWVSRRRLSTARGIFASAATRGRSFIQVASFAPCTPCHTPPLCVLCTLQHAFTRFRWRFGLACELPRHFCPRPGVVMPCIWRADCVCSTLCSYSSV
jgi:hypothetical protein